jgi:hypothetical protein
VADERTSKEQQAQHRPGSDFFPVKAHPSESAEGSVSEQGSLNHHFCPNKKGVVVELYLACDRSFRVEVRGQGGGKECEDVVREAVRSFLEAHEGINLACLGYKLELNLFESTSYRDVADGLIWVLFSLNHRAGGELVHNFLTLVVNHFEIALENEVPLVYRCGDPRFLVAVCVPRADLTTASVGETLSPMAEAGPTGGDIINKLEAESFTSLPEDEKELAVNTLSGALPNVPAETLASLFDAASFSDEQRKAVHEATGEPDILYDSARVGTDVPPRRGEVEVVGETPTAAEPEDGPTKNGVEKLSELPLERLTGKELVDLLVDEYGMGIREVARALGRSHGVVSHLRTGRHKQARPELLEELRDLVRKKSSE